MSSSERCTDFRDLAPELALGIADGEARARALEHLAGCAECRHYLDELSTTADELLALGPELEPPLGFEARVVDSIHPTPRRRRRWRPLPIAATAAAASLATAVALVLVYRDDHRLASQYRDTLSEANGSYFAAAPLRAPGGATVGQVFGYQGHPSWVLVTVNGPRDQARAGRYETQVVTAEGRRRTVGWIRIANGRGSYGRAIGMPLEAVNQVRLLGRERGAVLEAQLHE